MKILVFDLSADFAYFKSPEGTRSNFSFPFPPKTAMVGLLAAITGQVRNQYWMDDDFLALKMGIEMQKKSFTYGVKMNYWRSKTVASIGGKYLGLKFMLGGSDTKERGFTTQVKFDFLTDVKFRLYVNAPSELQKDIKKRLIENKYYYPPYLGHANLLAEINYIGEYEAEEITKGKFITIVPSTSIDTSLSFQILSSKGGFELYNSVPMKYRIEENHVNDDIKSYISIPDLYDSIMVPDINKTLEISLNKGTGYQLSINGQVTNVCLF